MKQYLLAVHGVEGEPMPPADEIQRAFAQVDRLNDDLQKAGVWVFAGGLLPPATATVVRVENGATTMTDGPFAETKEQIGGFWVLQGQDLDEALALAARGPPPRKGAVEGRPFQSG